MLRKGLLFIVAAVLAVTPVLADQVIQHFTAQDFRLEPVVPNELDEDSTMFEWDFEDEAWTSNDVTGVGIMWHTSNFNAYNEGTSWWCGEENLQGYDNHWLQYLETPVLNLSASTNPVLEFMMYLDCEAPGGEPQGFDGWDGTNVWYSLDGQNWEVLLNPTPAYNSTSLYSFGEEFEMGQGIPGWNGSTESVWMPVSFDLSAFEGEASFWLRFAFCSDPAEATPEGGYLGWFLDDIILYDDAMTYLENDAEGMAEPADLTGIEQTGNGNTWSLQTESYHSATHAWRMTVQDNLICAIVSPEFDVPPVNEWPITFMTYWVWCNMLDSDGDQNNTLEDYYLMDVSSDGGLTWDQLVYDYGYDNGTGNSLEGWVLRTYGLVGGQQTENIDLTPWAGETIRIRFRGRTDGDDNGGIGEGLHIDDVSIVSSSGLEFDIAVRPLDIPFPTTVGRQVPARVRFVNRGNNPSTFDAFWQFNSGPPRQFDDITLQPGQFVNYFMDVDTEDEYDMWMPTADQVGAPVTFNARHLATPDDDPTNDLTEIYPITVMPEGSYELGYDDRIPQFTTEVHQW